MGDFDEGDFNEVDFPHVLRGLNWEAGIIIRVASKIKISEDLTQI